MQGSKPVVWAAFFSAAFFALGSAIALAASSPSGTYAAVTPATVELLSLQTGKHGIQGTYRVLRLDPAKSIGMDDTTVALSAPGLLSEMAFTLQDSRSMILRFDATFEHAVTTTQVPAASRTQSFIRVNAQQAALLLEMARYGGLYEICQGRHGAAASNSRAICAGMSTQLAQIVPFRPFPLRGSTRPVLAYAINARMNHSLAFNR